MKSVTKLTATETVDMFLVSFVGVCLEIASLSESSSFFFWLIFCAPSSSSFNTFEPVACDTPKVLFSRLFRIFSFILKERFVGWAPLFYFLNRKKKKMNASAYTPCVCKR